MAEGGVPVVFPFTNYHKWERKPLCGVKKQHSCDTSTLLKQTRVVDTSKVLAPPKPLPKQCVDLDAAVLKARIAAKKTSLRDYKKLRDQLLTVNLALISTIQHVERNTLGEVSGLLERYDTFKDAIASVRRRSTKDLVEARCDLEATRCRVDQEISALREQGEHVASLVQSKSQDLNVLLNYKEKECPVKLLKMQRLKEQADVLSEMSEIEVAELEQQAEMERGVWQQRLLATKMDIEERAAKAAVERVREGVAEKALHNKIMEKEIDFHREKASELSRVIETLKGDISHLRQTIQEDKRRCKVLPLAIVRCTPDSEVCLDIPLRR